MEKIYDRNGSAYVERGISNLSTVWSWSLIRFFIASPLWEVTRCDIELLSHSPAHDLLGERGGREGGQGAINSFSRR